MVRRMEFVSYHFGRRPTDAKQARNCARLLTRILPVLFEDPSDPFLHNVFWNNKLPVAGAGSGQDADEGAGIDLVFEGAPSTVKVPSPVDADSAEETVAVEEPLLGRALLHSINRLLFAGGFCVDATAFSLFAYRLRELQEEAGQGDAEAKDDDGSGALHAADEDEEGQQQQQEQRRGDGGEGEGEAAAPASSEPTPTPAHRQTVAFVPTMSNSIWPTLLWHGGVKFPDVSPPQSSTFDSNRVDMLRLLMACMSPMLFTEPDVDAPTRNRFLDEAVAPNVPLGPTLFYSLLNTVLAYDPVGWGVPYASAVVSDSKEPLLDLSLQTLLLLLDHGRPLRVGESARSGGGSGGDGEETEAERPNRASGHCPNGYLSLLAGISSPEEFSALYNGITRLLNNVHESQSTLLPYAVKQVGCYQELLVLVWKLLDENRRFTLHILQEENLSLLLVPILYYMWRDRKNLARVGLLHIGTFIMLLLSGYRDFGVTLNAPFERTLPLSDLPRFQGSHADLLVIVLHKLVVDGTRRLSTLYSCFLTILANVSPYCKRFSMVAAVKLVNLFELFSAPRFLFASPEHPPLVGQLLEVFNNLIQYQYDGSIRVVYALVRQADLFERLIALRAPNGDEDSDGTPAPGAATEGAQTLRATLPVQGSADEDGEADDNEDAKREEAEEEEGEGAGGQGARSADTNYVERGTTAEVPAPASEHEAGEADDGEDSAAAAASSLQRGVTPAVMASTSQPAAGAGGEDAAAEDDENAAPASPAGSSGHGNTQLSPHGSFTDSASYATTWRPTEEWVESWKRQLPLYALMTALRHLTPRVMDFVHSNNLAVDEDAVLEFLDGTTLVGLLPQPHPIVTRRHEPNEYTALWFSTFLWGVIYLRNLELPIFDARRIRLFSLTLV